MANQEFGLKECAKCEYNVRCQECIYNKKDISKVIAETRADTVRKMYKMLHDKMKTIYTDENERLWYDIVELEDIDLIVEELKEETN